MDEAALRRQLDAITPEPTKEVLDAARLRLAERMLLAEADPDVRRRSGGPTRRVALGGFGIAAAAVAAAVLLTNAGPAPAASADVARALHGAAAAVSTRSITIAGCRQHYKRLVSLWDVTKSGDDSISSSYLYEGTLTLRQTDQPGVWERVWTDGHTIDAWGPERDEVLRRAAAEEPSAAPVTERSDVRSNFWEAPMSVSPQEIAAVPRDPDALVRYLSGATSPDDALMAQSARAMNKAAALLGSGLADARLQADVYRALEQLRGLTIDHHATDIDGRVGVAIQLVTSEGQQRIDLIIDPTTGRYLGYQQINLVPTAGAPAGTLEEGTAVHPL